MTDQIFGRRILILDTMVMSHDSLQVCMTDKNNDYTLWNEVI